MASEWTFIDTILAEDGDGTAISVRRNGPLILLCISSADSPEGAAIALDGDARDAFMHAWAAAEHQAEREAYVPQAVREEAR